MKKILYLIIVLNFILISCKSNHTVNCDAYGDNNFMIVPYTDTLIMDSYHFHFEEKQLCCWIPSDTTIYEDTIFLELIN